jgi:hypothetical protein
MYACMHVCMYACMHVCMYACMHACMYVCMYVRLFVCMCICLYDIRSIPYIYMYPHIYVHITSYIRRIYTYISFQRKKMSMTCFTNALNQNPPNTHRVQKCLQKLLRSLHKDRHHTIQHFRHLLETNFEQVNP